MAINDNKNAPLIVPNIASHQAVRHVMAKGLSEYGMLYVCAGFVSGGLSALVLSRSGTGRKVITAFGTGVGLGTAWTKTSMELEDILKDYS